METLTQLIQIVSLTLTLPAYLFLSPLCILSSDLYQLATGGDSIQKEFLLHLAVLLSISAYFLCIIFTQIKKRAVNHSFFAEFATFTAVGSCVLIGVIYFFLEREDFLEETMAKIFTAVLLIFLTERSKSNLENKEGCACAICFFEPSQGDCILLTCGHVYHQTCLWKWIYVRKICPTCFKALEE